MNIKFSAFLLACIISVSCTKEDDLTNHHFIGNQGIDLQLKWNSNSDGDQIKSLIAADLELEIYQGDNLIMASSNSDNFEKLLLQNQLEEGIYTITINYFSGIEPVSYKLFSEVVSDFSISGKFQHTFEGTQKPVAQLIVKEKSIVLRSFISSIN